MSDYQDFDKLTVHISAGNWVVSPSENFELTAKFIWYSSGVLCGIISHKAFHICIVTLSAVLQHTFSKTVGSPLRHDKNMVRKGSYNTTHTFLGAYLNDTRCAENWAAKFLMPNYIRAQSKPAQIQPGCSVLYRLGADSLGWGDISLFTHVTPQPALWGQSDLHQLLVQIQATYAKLPKPWMGDRLQHLQLLPITGPILSPFCHPSPRNSLSSPLKYPPATLSHPLPAGMPSAGMESDTGRSAHVLVCFTPYLQHSRGGTGPEPAQVNVWIRLPIVKHTRCTWNAPGSMPGISKWVREKLFSGIQSHCQPVSTEQDGPMASVEFAWSLNIV